MPQDERLKTMLDSLVNDKQEEAEIAFHGYLKDKMTSVVGALTGDEPEAEAAADVESNPGDVPDPAAD